MSAPLASRARFTDLPVGLQSHILSYLCEAEPHGTKLSQRRPPVELSLDGAEAVTHALPKDILPLAQASPRFSSAVVDVLGPHATYLTTATTSDRLAQWVSVLGPVVQAVSTYDVPSDYRSYEESVQQQFFRAGENALALCKALSGRSVQIQILDLSSITFYRCKELRQHILHGLSGALKQNSSTLRALALPVTRLCAKALELVSLKRLEVLKLKLLELDGTTCIIRTEIGRSAEAFMGMLRAFERGAGCEAVGRLRELRLVRVHEAPCIDVGPSGCTIALFNAIRTLRLDVIRSGNHDNDSVARFISLFPNLQRLDWNGVATYDHLQKINRACPKVQELHLRPYTHFSAALSMSQTPRPDDSAIRDLLVGSEGKLKTLVLKGLLRVDQLRLLGETCPGLEHLRIEIGSSNVRGLTFLLGTFCRRIRKLEMPLNSCLMDPFDYEDWRTLTNALLSTSDQLVELAIWLEDCSIPLSIRLEAMAQSVVHVLESIGGRVRVARFHLSLMEGGYPTAMDALCRILRTCAMSAKELECLEAHFRIAKIRYNWDSEEQENVTLTQLGKERQRLVTEAPRLRSLSLRPLCERARKKLDEMGL